MIRSLFLAPAYPEFLGIYHYPNSHAGNNKLVSGSSLNGLCCLMTPDLSKDMYDHTFSKLANHHIRHQATHKQIRFICQKLLSLVTEKQNLTH